MILTAWLLGSGVALAAAPDLTGIWQPVTTASTLKSTDGKAVPLLPDAAAVYAKNRAALKRGDDSFDPAAQCISPSIPWLLADRMPLQIVSKPNNVFMLFQWNRLFRQIDLNVAHSEPPGPTYFGQSVGRWQGDELIVDTNNIETNSLLDHAGMPHSDQLHLVERYRLKAGGKRLLLDLRIEDPQVFAAPWSARLEFRKLAGVKIQEDVCVERLDIRKYR
ncbi:MAG: hypothetical protein QM718_06430 [Steroidobacteraceae bacterium]